MAEVVRRVPGASNVYPEQVTSGQYLNVVVDRAAAARFGIGVGDVQAVDRDRDRRDGRDDDDRRAAAVSGPRAIRPRVSRAIPQAIGNVLVAAPNGTQIPLGQLARIEHTRGPAMLASENGLLLATVLLNVQGRDVGGFVEEAKAAVGRERARCRRATTSRGAAGGRTRSAHASACRWSSRSS